MASTLLASQAFSKSPSGPEQRCEENMETAAAEQLEAADERATVNPQTADSGSAPTQQLRFFIATITGRKPQTSTCQMGGFVC